MTGVQQRMSDLKIKEETAIRYLKTFEPKTEPYYLCYSGGKDSDVIRILAQLADVKHECKHSLTTADAPETVNYVKETIGAENIVRAYYDDGMQKTMWNLIPKKRFPPTRMARYCCEQLKEGVVAGRLKVTGVRWSESPSRKAKADFVRIIGKASETMKSAEEDSDARISQGGGVLLRSDNADNRRLVEHCYRDRSTTVNPIVDWTDDDVWEFLHHYGCKSNPLYACGFKRIGCCICPLGGFASMRREADFFPKYREMYVSAFDRMLKERAKRGMKNNVAWTDGESVFRWWIGLDPAQITFEDYMAGLEYDEE